MTESELINNILTMKDRLKLIRVHYGLKQVELGEAMGVSKQAIHSYMTGRNNPKPDRIDELCKNFPQLNARWIRFGEGEMLRDIPMGTVPNVLRETGTQYGQVMVDLREVIKNYYSSVETIKDILTNTTKLLTDTQNSYKPTIESLDK